MEEELWEPILDFPGYEVSNHGRARSFWRQYGRGRGIGAIYRLDSKPQKILKLKITKYGYLQAVLLKNGKDHYLYIHRLVLLAFVGPCPTMHETRHLDGNKKNNCLTNLCWGTRKENGEDMAMHGSQKGEKHHAAKLTEADIIEIRQTKGSTLLELSRRYGVGKTAIFKIIHRKRWGHVGDRPIGLNELQRVG